MIGYALRSQLADTNSLRATNFFGMLECYNTETCTFSTLVGELGITLEEMHVVSGLPSSECPYEEYIPSTEKLNRLEKMNPDMHETYWEVLSFPYM